MAGGGGAAKDFFVSYTGADTAWAEWIAWVLTEAGYAVHIQAWDFVPGSNWVAKMQEGAQAERTLVVLSTAFLAGSAYGAAEWQAAFAQDPEGLERRLIPVRIEDCERPGLLKAIAGFDLFGLDEVAAKQRLLQQINATVSGSAMPTSKPAFPTWTSSQAPFPGIVARIWNVPPRNPNFTGRAQQLIDLRERLRTGENVTVQSIRGMGGIGKSQLAIEYAYRHAADYDLVWFLASESAALLPDQFARLADAIGLTPITDPVRQRTAVHRRLQDVHRWLLVFDNAEVPGDIREWIPSQPLTPGRAGHVLVTTRRAGFGSMGRVVNLELLSSDEALALLRTRIHGIDAEVAGRVAELLGYLPLALEQATAYLERTGIDPRTYAELLQTRLGDILQRGADPDRGEKTVATLWQLSLDRLAKESPAAVQMIEICAHLAPEPIPFDLFTEHADVLSEPLASAAADALTFHETVGALSDYSLLLNRTAETMTFHRLLQAAVRAGVDRTEVAERALGLLSRAAPQDGEDELASWPRWAQLLPHILAATLSLSSEATSLVLSGATRYLRIHGRLAEVRPLLEQALARDEAAFGADDPRVASGLSNLATVLAASGDPAGAQPLAERALAIDEEAFGHEHPRVAVRLSDLATVLKDLDDVPGARALLERALAIAERAYGRDHPSTGTIRRRLVGLTAQPAAE